MSRGDQLLHALPAALISEEDARRAAAAIVAVSAMAEAVHLARTDGLASLVSPEDCPAALLPHLGAIVGLSPAWLALAAGDEAAERRLIGNAMELWRSAGTQAALRRVVAALSGSRSVILSWFERRAIDGTWGAVRLEPAVASSVGCDHDNPERVTDVWIEDPEGSAPLDLLVALLQRLRRGGERVRVYVAELVDDFLVGPARWAAVDDGGEGIFDPESNALVTHGGYHYEADLGGVEASWEDVHAILRLGITDAAEIRICHQDADNGYRVRIDEDADQVVLARVVGGVATTLATVAQQIAPSFPLTWTVEAVAVAASTRLRVYMEGWLVLEYSDSHAARFDAGGVRWGAPAGATTATCTCAIVWTEPITSVGSGPTP